MIKRWGNRSLTALILSIGMLMQGCMSDPYKTRSFKNVFDHYRVQEGIEAISFPPGIVRIFLSDTDPDQAEIKKLMQDLSSFRMLILDTDAETREEGVGTELREAVNDFTIRNEFQDLFRMQSAGQDIFIRILEKDGTVKEALLMFDSDGSFFVINLRGDISLEHFTRLLEGGYLEGLTELAELDF